MSNEVAKQEQSRNYFEQYGDSVTPTVIVGKLLKMTKFGEWKAGQEEEDIAIGTRLLVNMNTLKIGWQKWVDNKPSEQKMGYLIDGFTPAKRDELGDDDEAMWDVMPDGQPRDPWQFTNVLIMLDPETDELFTFATGSKGGWGAIGELAKAYGKRVRMAPDEHPLIELQVRSYTHATYGEIRAPKFMIVGWNGLPEALLTIGSGDAGELPPPDEVAVSRNIKVAKPTAPAKPKPAGKKAPPPPPAKGKKNGPGKGVRF